MKRSFVFLISLALCQTLLILVFMKFGILLRFNFLTDYNSIKESNELRLPNDIILLVLINTTPTKIAKRMTLRETWARKFPAPCSSGTDRGNGSVVFLYTVGRDGNQTINREIDKEAQVYKDILRVDVNESYLNILPKILKAFKWVLSQEAKPRFIIKADDDIYVKLPELMKWLHDSALPEKLYAGFVHSGARVTRSPNSPYYVSQEQYSENTFPDYCAGPFYVLSRSALRDIMDASNTVPLFLIEDVYVGVLANTIELKPYPAGWHLFHWNRNLKHRTNGWKELSKVPSAIAMGDSLNYDDISKLHLLLKNSTNCGS